MALFSPAELFSAWERVRENDGCAGSDGVTLSTFAHNHEERLQRLEALVESGGYRPFPLLKIVVEKRPNSGKTRTLLVPAVRDRILQTAAARELSKSFEEEFLECSYAYRPGRSVDRAVARIRELHLEGFHFVVDADIEAFFDNVDHDLLFERLRPIALQLPALASLIRAWVRAEVWDGAGITHLRKGIPQGSPISPLLANYFLEDLDRALESSGRKTIRYADDFLILARNRPEAEQALGQARASLQELHMELSPQKTMISSFDDGFHFLGAYFHADDIWTPWKNGQKHPGKIFFMAHPLPPRMRLQYERSQVASALARALERIPLHQPSPAESLTSSAERHVVAYLYLTQQGSVLRKTGDRLLVEKDEQILLDLPYHKLDHVLLFGNIQVTTQAMAELLEKGVPLSLFSRQGNFRGSLMPAAGKNIELRIKQFDAYRDGARALALACATVHSKIANGLDVLERVKAHHDSPDGFLTKRNGVRDRLASVEGVRSVQELDGVEGSAARDYFDALMMFNHSPLVWSGRQKHPAVDPLNALMSLTYTLLAHEMTALSEGAGLDPYLGFLHQVDYGRPSLALDLIEPFRHPFADRLVLKLVNLGVLGPEDFEGHEGRTGAWLKPPAMIRFFEHYERWMISGKPSPRDRLKQEVAKLAACLRSGGPWTPFRLEGEMEGEWNTSSVTI